MRGKDCEDLIILLMIRNKEVNQSLENQLREMDSRIEIQNYLRPAWMKTPEKRDYFRQLKNCLKAELPPRGQVHDHTIHQLPEEHENFCFRKLEISHMDESQNQKLSLQTLLAMNHDMENNQLILKMDVEGAEWDFLAEVSEQVLSRFRQITFELHRLTDISQSERILGGLEKLNRTHQLVWIHANNFGHIERAGENLEIPAYVEATYLNRALYHTHKGSCCFPLPVDMPVCPYIEEYILGEWDEQ